ncbi:hypothetical protein CLF_110483 [Clonorchis sinensis]|uniref:Uncharacterized protein n=1 Tax=Clonorchis sinensis TaxID=79923 RepID=G7YKS4_CLOSI|nr:hypothetical protein CLF_110483 [Clonorchis sinensis]
MIERHGNAPVIHALHGFACTRYGHHVTTMTHDSDVSARGVKRSVKYTSDELKLLAKLTTQARDLLYQENKMHLFLEYTVWNQIANHMHALGFPKRSWVALRMKGVRLLTSPASERHRAAPSTSSTEYSSHSSNFVNTLSSTISNSPHCSMSANALNSISPDDNQVATTPSLPYAQPPPLLPSSEASASTLMALAGRGCSPDLTFLPAQTSVIPQILNVRSTALTSSGNNQNSNPGCPVFSHADNFIVTSAVPIVLNTPNPASRNQLRPPVLDRSCHIQLSVSSDEDDKIVTETCSSQETIASSPSMLCVGSSRVFGHSIPDGYVSRQPLFPTPQIDFSTESPQIGDACSALSLDFISSLSLRHSMQAIHTSRAVFLYSTPTNVLSGAGIAWAKLVYHVSHRLIHILLRLNIKYHWYRHTEVCYSLPVYIRYVDDVFVLLGSESNNTLPNVCLIVPTKSSVISDSTVPFLVVDLTRHSRDTLSWRISRKAICTVRPCELYNATNCEDQGTSVESFQNENCQTIHMLWPITHGTRDMTGLIVRAEFDSEWHREHRNGWIRGETFQELYVSVLQPPISDAPEFGSERVNMFEASAYHISVSMNIFTCSDVKIQHAFPLRDKMIPLKARSPFYVERFVVMLTLCPDGPGASTQGNSDQAQLEMQVYRKKLELYLTVIPTPVPGARKELADKEHSSFIATSECVRVQKLQRLRTIWRLLFDIDPGCLIGVW